MAKTFFSSTRERAARRFFESRVWSSRLATTLYFLP